MKKKTRILAFLLSVLMLFSVMPLSIFASEADGESTSYEQSALEYLAKMATGSPFVMTDYGEIKEVLGENGTVFNDGYFGTKADGTAGYVSTDADLTAAEGPNNTKESFVSVNGEYQFVDVKNAGDINFTYTATNKNFDDAKYIVVSANVKRGDVMKNNETFMRFRLKNTEGSTKTYNAAQLYNEKIRVADKDGGDFSTSIYTNVTLVYDIENNTLTGYANGVLLGTKENAVVSDAELNQFVNLSFRCTRAFDGRFISVKDTRMFFVNSAGALENCVYADATPANGVFKIDGDYYLFENNFPVLGATKTVSGYTVVTEEKTGKIVECYKTESAPELYERWDSAEYEKNGITLHKNGLPSLDGVIGTSSYEAYNHTKIEENGTTYYLLEASKSAIKNPWNVLTEVADGVELTKKILSDGAFTSTSGTKTTVDGETVYKTENTPNQGSDLSYYFNVKASAYQTVGVISFRLRAGEGIYDLKSNSSKLADKDLSMDIIRINQAYTRDANQTATKFQNKDLGKIQFAGGLPYLYISGFNCGVLSTEVFTEIALRIYIDGGALKYDVYANGINQGTYTAVESGVCDFRINEFGIYAGKTYNWERPLLTIGNIQTYYKDILKANENPYSGTYQARDGYYTYENGIATAFNKNESAGNYAVMNAYSATLDEKLGLNFYTILPEGAKTVKLTFGGEEQIIDVDTLAPISGSLYKLTAKLSSIEVGKKVELSIFDAHKNRLKIKNGDKAYDSFIYSTKDYVNALIESNAATESALTAAKALLNYAAYAEKYFGKSADFATAYTQGDRVTVPTADVSALLGEVSAGAGASEILSSVQLVLDDATKIRINLLGKAEVTSSYKDVKYVEGTDRIYIDICGIDAKNLDTVYELTVNGVSVKISVLGVAAIVINDADSYGADFVNLMKSLCLYSAASENV